MGIKSKIKVLFIRLVLICLVTQMIACSENENSFKKYSNCVNDKLNRKFKKLSKFNGSYKGKEIHFFDSINDFKSQLIKEKILLESNRDGFKTLINDLTNEKISLIKKSIIEKNEFLNYISDDATTMNLMFDACPIESKLPNSIKKKYFELFSKGYPTKEILFDLIENNNFKSEVFQQSIIYLLFIHIKYFNFNKEIPQPVF